MRRSGPSPAAFRRRKRPDGTSFHPRPFAQRRRADDRPVLANACRSIAIAPRFGQRRKLADTSDLEPGEPHAFALALVPDAVHTVIPVTMIHEREAMRAEPVSPVKGAGTVVVKRS